MKSCSTVSRISSVVERISAVTCIHVTPEVITIFAHNIWSEQFCTMKCAKEGKSYFFVDESGDPAFFDSSGRNIVGQPGCSPILVLGFIETQTPRLIRKAVLDVHAEVMSDPYLKAVPRYRRPRSASTRKTIFPKSGTCFTELLDCGSRKCRSH
jgi:hypothetical protein